MRLIWEGEKLARSIPQRTARRASRFFSLRLFFSSVTSEDSSPLSLASESGGTSRNFSARERERTWRYAVEKDAKKGRLVVARAGYERRLRRCEKVEQRRRHRCHWMSGRSTWAILRRVKSSYCAQYENWGPVTHNKYGPICCITYRNSFLGLILNIYLFLLLRLSNLYKIAV